MKKQVFKTDSSLAVQTPHIKGQKGSKKAFLYCLCQILLSLCAVLGTAVCFISALDLVKYFKIDSATMVYLIPAVSTILYSLIFFFRKSTKFTLPATIVVTLAGLGIMWKYIAKGAVLFYNFMAYTLWDYRGIVIEKAEVPFEKGIANNISVSMFLIAFFVLFSLLLSYAIVRRASFWITIVATIIPTTLALNFYYVAPPAFAFFALVVCWISLFSFKIGTSAKVKKKDHFAKTGKKTFRVSSLDYVKQTQGQQIISTLIVSVLCFSLLLVMVPTSSYQLPSQVADRGEQLYKYVDKELLRGVKNFLGLSSEGNLSSVDDKYIIGSVDLKVYPHTDGVFDNISYLRSYVGSVYTTKAWQPIEDDVFEKYDIFDRVSPKEYQPQFVDANYSAFLGAKNDDFLLSVQNKAANNFRIFAPFNSVLDKGSWKDSSKFSLDGAIKSSNFFGTNSYDVLIRNPEFKAGKSVYYPSIKQTKFNKDAYIKGAAEVNLNYNQLSVTNNEQKKYVVNEKDYRKFVFDNYLEVPESAKEAVDFAVSLINSETIITDEALEDEGLTRDTVEINDLKNGKLQVITDDGRNYLVDGSFSSDYVNRAVYAVRNYLAKSTEYTIKDIHTSSKVDFVDYFLNYTQKGYDIHYATAATLFLRTLGVPARYAEGYVLNDPVLPQNTDEAGFIEITDQSYHSWVEVYQPGQGWVPVEVTPGFYINDLSFKLQNEDDFLEEDEEPFIPEVPESVPEYPYEHDPNVDNDLTLDVYDIVFTYWWLFTLILIVLATVGFIVFVVLRRKSVLKKREAAFKSSDLRVAIMAMYRYVTELFEFDGLPIQLGQTNMDYAQELSGEYKIFTEDEFAKFTEIALAAKYSEREMTSDDLLYVKRFTNTLLSHIYACSNHYRKLIMKYIKDLV